MGIWGTFKWSLIFGFALAVWLGSSGVAHADICKTQTVKTTTGTLCVTGIVPQGGSEIDPVLGQTVNVTGNTVVKATMMYTPGALPSGEKRGCGGERLTPSGCITWYVNGTYTLTRLFADSSSTSGNTRTQNYQFTWATSQYPNGNRTISAQVKTNDVAMQVDVAVAVSNTTPSQFPSPVPNCAGQVACPPNSGSGLLPSFVQGGQPGGFVVAALGDGPSGSSQTARVAQMVHSWSPGMLMYLGDVYQRGQRDEFTNFYQPAYGADWLKTVPTIGNHEYKYFTAPGADGGDGSIGGDGYFWYWNFPKMSPAQPNGGGGWYSLNAAGWHIVNLNSNVAMNLNATSTNPNPSPQALWLQQDLAADKAARPLTTRPCTLTFWHHARFSDISLRKPSTSYLWNQLYPYKADVIVNAHSHVYERWSNMNNTGGKATTSPTGIPAGITEFVSGTGGNVLAQTWQTDNPNADFRNNTRWGALKLVLYPTSVHFEYWVVDTDGAGPQGTQILDQGDIKCH